MRINTDNMIASPISSIVFENKMISLYKIENANGLSAEITNHGAKIVRLFVPDKNGVFDDIVLGFDTLEEYLHKEPYFGAVCGRVANRIKDGKFTLDDKDYSLVVNNGTNHLHGGNVGFNAKIWDVVSVCKNTIVLSYLSPDGEENYPGNLNVTVTYTLTDENELKIHYEATTDKPTIVGLTQHSYFNLKGAGNGTIRDHYLEINADYYTVLDDSFAVTGEIRPVVNTSFDFRTKTLIDERIDDVVFVPGRGLDNNWCLKKKQMYELSFAASLTEQASGRKMDVYTTQPGLQVYSGNWIEKQTGKGGEKYNCQDAICLETQSIPNAVNIPYIQSPVLRPREKYDEWCIYKFSCL